MNAYICFMSITLGKLFTISIFGDSHGPACGAVLGGCPPGLKLNLKLIEHELQKRKTGGVFFSSSREEPDTIKILSGVNHGKCTGGPLAFIIENKDQKASDYHNLDELFRPGHADFTYFKKYGAGISAGKLHASARILTSIVVAGNIARQYLLQNKINIKAYVKQIGSIACEKNYDHCKTGTIEKSPLRCPDIESEKKMLEILKNLKAEGDSTGGVIRCIVSGCPAGLGDPPLGKLQSELSAAMFSINAVKGFEYGDGFASAAFKGSEYNDGFIKTKNKIVTNSRHSGGIQGGITNGGNIVFQIAFSPPSGISKTQQTLDRNGESITFNIQGRHDVCFVPRAVPIVEAMTAITITDAYLKFKAYDC